MPNGRNHLDRVMGDGVVHEHLVGRCLQADHDQTMQGFEKSARKLGVDQIDLVMATRHGLPGVFRRRNGVLLLVVELLDGSPGTVRADATNIFAAAPMAPTGLVLDGDGPGAAWSGCGVAPASGFGG